MARGVSAFTFLSIGTGEGTVLTGALAYGLRSSLDSVFANGARTPVPLLSSGGGSPSPLGAARLLGDAE